jgi:hypothetical protein
MDLSKAFDCFPHELHLLKLKAHGLSKAAHEMQSSYLSLKENNVVKLGSTSAACQI